MPELSRADTDSGRACKRILVVGYSGAGKDTVCEYLARITTLRFAGSTSQYLARHVAAHLGVSEEVARQSRHRDRNLWHRVAKSLRRSDPGVLIRESLAHAEIIAGVRAMAELALCRDEGLVDLILWIANDRVPAGSTVEFSERDCDLTLPNHSTLAELHRRLDRLARFAGLPLKPGGSQP